MPVWDSWGGGGGVTPPPSSPPRCLNTQAQNYCGLIDPVADAPALYKFTQTFSDAALRPGEHVSDGTTFGHPHYTVTFSAAEHSFHEAIGALGRAQRSLRFVAADANSGLHRSPAPMAVYIYNGKYPGDSFVARQFEPIVVECVNKLPNDHLFLVDPYIPHTPASGGADNVLPSPPAGMNADIAGPDGLRDGRGSQGRAVVHLHGGHQPSFVDGEPDAWFTPLDAPVVAGVPSVGSDFCASTYKYPNIRAAGTLWVRYLH